MANERLKRIESHLRDNPNDYQTAISYLKLRSDEFDYQRKQKQIEMYKQIAKFKGEANGK